MSTFSVVAISVQPTFATRNTAGNVAPPGSTLVAWSPPGTQYEDGAGSTEPVTFRLPDHGHTLASVTYPVHVAGMCTVPKELAGRRFEVVGSLQMGAGGWFPVLGNAATTNIVTPTGITPVAATGFIVNPAFMDLPDYPVPFRIAGNFQWKVSIAGQPDVVAPILTRLEIAFTRTAAPSGPTEITDPTTKTMMDLGGIYPIRVVRTYLPEASELDQPDYQANPVAWYLARVAQYVWGWGNSPTPGRPKYDALNGASFFGVGARGGNVNFDAWLAGTATQCNCYDLAAMVQLGCAILTDSGTVAMFEQSDSRWVFQAPTGYILNCVLYGWGRVGSSPPDFPMGLNNPFFMRFPQPYPYIGDVASDTRLPFGNHAWIEAYSEPIAPGTARRVLDCTTATWDAGSPVPRPDAAVRTRSAYLGRHIDVAADPTVGKQRTGNGQDWLQGNPMSHGSCQVNNTGWMVNAAHPANRYRIGVWNVSAIPLPGYLRCLLSNSLPDSIMDDINAVIEKASIPQAPGAKRFSDAVLNAESIARIVSRLDHALAIRQTLVHVSEESSLLEVLIDGARASESVSGRINLSLHTFNDDALALAALVHTLSGYTVQPLVDLFDRTPNPLGHVSMVDKSHTAVYFLRGNHFVSVRFIPAHDQVRDLGLARPGHLDPCHVTALAESVHAHVASREVPPGHQLQPGLRFREQLPDNGSPADTHTPLRRTVRVGEVFELSVATADANEHGDDFAVLRGDTGNGAVVICTSRTQQASGAGEMTNVVQFYAVAAGDADIYVHAAHRDTLAPGSVKCKVKVVP